MFGNVLGIAKRFASGSDIPIIAFIVSDPGNKEGTLDRADAQRHLKGCRDDEVFFKLSSTPECHSLRGHTAFCS